MVPDEAEPVRRLLVYDEETGGLMTTEPVIMRAADTVAEALARVRDPDLPARPGRPGVRGPGPDPDPDRPLPGRGLPARRLLREPPGEELGACMDTDLDCLGPSRPGRWPSTWPPTTCWPPPVCDPPRRLLGAVSIDDVLDHLLPEAWRPGRGVAVRVRPGRGRRTWSLGRRGIRPRLQLQPLRPGGVRALLRAIARFLGTARFLVFQTAVVALWILWNVVFRNREATFDPYPFILPLTLALSLQASYTAPLILLAQNRRGERDRQETERDRRATGRTQADTEYLARELAAIRLALGEMPTRDYLDEELEQLSRASGEAAGPDRGIVAVPRLLVCSGVAVKYQVYRCGTIPA